MQNGERVTILPRFFSSVIFGEGEGARTHPSLANSICPQSMFAPRTRYAYKVCSLRERDITSPRSVAICLLKQARYASLRSARYVVTLFRRFKLQPRCNFQSISERLYGIRAKHGMESMRSIAWNQRFAQFGFNFKEIV